MPTKPQVPGPSQGGARRSLTTPHVDPQVPPPAAGFIRERAEFSFTKVQHTVHANTYIHLHNGFHVKRFVMRPEIRRDRRCCRELSAMARRSFVLLQGKCQYKEAEETGSGKFMQRSAGEWEMT